MNCDRAVVLLRALEKNELAATGMTSEEIEELLGLGLAVEADPDDYATMAWLVPIVRQYAFREVDAPDATEALSAALRQTEEELQKDWYRMKTSKEVLAQREESRIHMRRALALLADRPLVQRIAAVVAVSRQIAQDASFVVCEPLGSELYAITHKGWRVRRQLKIRLERFGQASLKAFLASFEKVDAKMRAFSGEISVLAQNIGYVKKNREQVVIGLAKTGAPAAQALGAYQQGMQAMGNAPDVAVTCARNAATYGSAAQAAQMLKHAQAALAHQGIRMTPVAAGAAKALLAYNPPSSAVPRFMEIYKYLQHAFGNQEVNLKYTARLLPAHGTPRELVDRAVMAQQILAKTPRSIQAPSQQQICAVALASMVREPNALPGIVVRFRQIEHELVRAGVTSPAMAEMDALECVGCPGNPMEVVDTVAALVAQLSQGRRAERGDVAVAVAFAKRFAL